MRWRRRPAHPSDAELVRLTDEDRRYMTSKFDTSVPLPAGAEEELRADNPRLRELREDYAELDLPALRPSRWHAAAVDRFLELRWFRGETLITWHDRELPRVTRLRYFVLLRHVAARDGLGLLRRLEEDGAFGCWTFEYPGEPRVSRDLLESVLELNYVERALGVSGREAFRVLDVGAGYGRLAHRAAGAFDNLTDYCCVDAIPESTFLAEWYLRHRGVCPPARVVPLHRLDDELRPGDFDLAVNVHSFSECTYEAVAWWARRLAALRVPRLLVVPNHGSQLLTHEVDHSERDFLPALETAGYRRAAHEPVVDDPAVAELVVMGDDWYHLFELEG
ncbi:MAG: putative sugar O-methyltransferase [Actinomycetota bacterium]|nr:putative sugar O-methyltransferase [Actinomycetota bacterium]